MKRIVSCLALALSMLASSAAFATTTTFRSTMSGPSEQPPNNSPGYSIAMIVLDDVAQTLSMTIPFFDLIANTTAGHLHCCTAMPLMGVAPVAIPFDGFPAGVRSGTYERTFNLADASTYDPAFISANGGSAQTALTALIAGIVNNESYNNIHTTTYPGGEIRGFLVPVPEPSTWLMLGIGLAGIGFCAARRRAS